MSEQRTDIAGESVRTAGETGPQAFCVVVKSPRPVYRRAGYSLVRGKNTLPHVTPEQLAILRADTVLSLVSETPVSPEAPQGRMDVLDVGGLNAEHLNTVQDELREVLTATATTNVPEAPSLSLRIRRVVAGLDKANPAHYTQSGTPRITAVCEALGEVITAAQLKAAMDEASA